LTRTEVRGGGRKPWRQKGTGHARQGSIRAPQWKGGGVVFAPKPRDYSFSINKKVKRLALCSALSDKVLADNLIVVDKIELEEYKTKSIVNMLKALGVDAKALIVTAQKNEYVVKSAGNIAGVESSNVGMINVYDVLNHDKLVIAKDAVEKLEEVYA